MKVSQGYVNGRRITLGYYAGSIISAKSNLYIQTFNASSSTADSVSLDKSYGLFLNITEPVMTADSVSINPAESAAVNVVEDSSTPADVSLETSPGIYVQEVTISQSSTVESVGLALGSAISRDSSGCQTTSDDVGLTLRESRHMSSSPNSETLLNIGLSISDTGHLNPENPSGIADLELQVVDAPQAIPDSTSGLISIEVSNPLAASGVPLGDASNIVDTTINAPLILEVTPVPIAGNHYSVDVHAYPGEGSSPEVSADTISNVSVLPSDPQSCTPVESSENSSRIEIEAKSPEATGCVNDQSTVTNRVDINTRDPTVMSGLVQSGATGDEVSVSHKTVHEFEEGLAASTETSVGLDTSSSDPHSMSMLSDTPDLIDVKATQDSSCSKNLESGSTSSSFSLDLWNQWFYIDQDGYLVVLQSFNYEHPTSSLYLNLL